MIWTIPVLAVIAALKFAWLRWMTASQGQLMFNPADLFPRRPFDLLVYLSAMGTYSAFVPLQELVARAGLQGTLQHFAPTPPNTVNWKAILISNLLFSAAHAFIGFWFCVAAFVPGIFWGWMFAKQRSLIGVTVSHIMVGVWALFVLGVRSVVGGG
jgi:membrane protease YdiL (CAAX protease family)